MALERKPNGVNMLIATHAMHATLPFPFLPAQWTQVSTSTFGTTNVNAVTSNGDGQFIAVGSAGKVASSDDGINWTARESQFDGSNIYAVAYGDGIYVIG